MNALKTSESFVRTRKTVLSSRLKMDEAAHSFWAHEGKLVKWPLVWSESCIPDGPLPDIKININ